MADDTPESDETVTPDLRGTPAYALGWLMSTAEYVACAKGSEKYLREAQRCERILRAAIK